jgi:acyl CoA:acetate/3-ketoacid CoA transferase beta subunit
MDARKACRDKKKLDQWLEKWVLGCSDQDEYLRRLGGAKVRQLKGKASPDAWRYDSEAFAKVDKKSDYNPSEMMTIAMARCLIKKILDNKYSTILAGIGQANLAAWVANYQLKELHNYPLNLIAEVGMYGYAPRPGDPFVFNHGNVPSAKLLTDSFQTLGMMVGGEMNTCIGALGSGMVDKEGNMNSTVVTPNILISGSGGGNDTASSAQEVIASLTHSRERVVDRVPYVTCPGTRVKTVVTTLGVFEKLGDDRELTLTQLLPSVENSSVEAKVKEIKEKTGWDLKVHPDVQFMAQPTMEELVMIRLFDPHGYFIGR